MSLPHERLFILGVDAADYHLVSALLAAGELPAFAQVAREGFFAPLPSMTPPVSAMVWPSLCTGCSPARHGIWTFFNREPGSLRWRPARATDWAVPSLWQLVNMHGLSAAVLHVPVTYPPVPLKGVLISDSLMSPEDAIVSYPPDLFPRLKARYPDYSLTFWRPEQEDYLGDLRRFFDARKAASLEVVRTCEGSLHFYVLNCVDWTSHRYPLTPAQVPEAVASGHPLVQAYRMADEFLGALLELMDDTDSLLIVSDHGSQPAEAIFLINEWLERHRFLRYQRNLDVRARIAAIKVWKALPGREGLRRVLARRARPRKDRRGDLQRMLAAQILGFTDVDEERTLALSYGPMAFYQVSLAQSPGRLFANQDREVHIVAARLEEELAQVRSPDGQLFAKRIWRAEELYGRPGAWTSFQPPDLIIEPRNWSLAWANIMGGGALGAWWPAEGLLKGNHSADGVLMGLGRAFRKGAQPSARVIDIAPTALAALRLKVPPHIEGRALEEALA